MDRIFGVLVVLSLGVFSLGCEDSNAKGPPEQAPQGSAPAVSEDDPGDPDDRLTGSWLAKDVDTDAGPMEMQVEFREDGGAKLVAISELPFAGEMKRIETGYSIKDGQIHCEQDGRVMPYAFEGDHTLVLTYDKDHIVRFTRTAEEDPEGAVKEAPPQS